MITEIIIICMCLFCAFGFLMIFLTIPKPRYEEQKLQYRLNKIGTFLGVVVSIISIIIILKNKGGF